MTLDPKENEISIPVFFFSTQRLFSTGPSYYSYISFSPSSKKNPYFLALTPGIPGNGELGRIFFAPSIFNQPFPLPSQVRQILGLGEKEDW